MRVYMQRSGYLMHLVMACVLLADLHRAQDTESRFMLSKLEGSYSPRGESDVEDRWSNTQYALTG